MSVKTLDGDKFYEPHTCTVEGYCSLDHSMNKFFDNLELFIGLKQEESMEIPLFDQSISVTRDQ